MISKESKNESKVVVPTSSEEFFMKFNLDAIESIKIVNDLFQDWEGYSVYNKSDTADEELDISNYKLLIRIKPDNLTLTNSTKRENTNEREQKE